MQGLSYEEELAERIRQSIGNELQRSGVDITVTPIPDDEFQHGHRVVLGTVLHGRRWEFVTTQRTDDADASRFLVAMFRRALERKIANG